MIIMLMMLLTVMALTLLDGSVEDGVDAPLIEAAGHRRRWRRSACLQRLGVDRAMVLMLFSYCWQWCVVSYSMLRTAFFNLGNDGVQLLSCWGKWCSWWGSKKSDNGVKLMTMMINMKKTMMLITSMIMSPASLTLSLPDPQEPWTSALWCWQKWFKR